MVAFRLPPAIVFYSFGMIVAYEYRFTEYEYERRLVPQPHADIRSPFRGRSPKIPTNSPAHLEQFANPGFSELPH